MATKQIIEKFTSSVDISTNYAITDLVKLLKETYKTVKTTDMNGNPKTKKPPSAYNLFIKKEMEQLQKGDIKYAPKDLMREATKNWKTHKESLEKISDGSEVAKVAKVANDKSESESETE